MSRVDRILELLDNATQDSREHGYGTDTHHDSCWRCQGPPGEGASGVCDSCRVVLLDESLSLEPYGPPKPHGSFVSGQLSRFVVGGHDVTGAVVNVRLTLPSDDAWRRAFRDAWLTAAGGTS